METNKKGDKMKSYSPLQPHKAVKCISCNLHFSVSESTEEPYICEKCKSETFRTERLKIQIQAIRTECTNCGKIIYKQSPEEIPLCNDCIHLFFKEFNNPENGNLTIKEFREKISKPKNLKSITATFEIK